MFKSARSIASIQRVHMRNLSNYIVLGSENKLQELTTSKGNKVFYFTATWCPPCRFIAPVFEKLSKQYTNTTFLKIDVDEFQSAAGEYHISSIPTFVFLSDDKVVNQVGELFWIR